MRDSTYITVLRTRGMKAWLAVVLFQRLPVAMAPLAFVYLGEATTGSFAVGAALAGVFALAEAVFAGAMGRRFDRRSPRREMQLVLGAQAIALLVLGTAAAPLPVGVLVALAAIAGAVAAGAHGGLRALLVRITPPERTQAALSLEGTITALMWAVGPALVAALAVIGDATWPVLATAALAGAGTLASRRMPDLEPADGGEETAGVWRQAWPAMVQEGAVLLLVGTAYATLPALLLSADASSDLAGPALGGFALAGIVGGLLYGTRPWPAPYRVQVVALVLGLSAAIGAVALAPSPPVIILLVVVAGFAGTPALTARAAALQELLPESRWAAGFSGLYAAGGIGFGAAGLLIAPLLVSADPRLAFAAAAAVAASAVVLTGLAEARAARPRGRAVPVPAA